MHKPTRPPYGGPALFSYGFRPFFLAAGLFAVMIVPLWMLIWSGNITLNSPFAAMDWHIHEMLFGYTSAVIAGFLFTAIPNWTGRMPTRGWSLMVLAAFWIAGRLAVAGAFGQGPVLVMVVDCAFMAAIGAMRSLAPASRPRSRAGSPAPRAARARPSRRTASPARPTCRSGAGGSG